MPSMRVVVDQENPEVRRVVVNGEIDLAASAELQTRLAEASRGPAAVVIVDLSECLFIDSRGLSTLLNAARRLTRTRSPELTTGAGPT